MALNVSWGNALETLADDLFAKLAEQPANSPMEVFAKRDCIVVPNRVQQAWLQQRFLYDLDRSAAPVPHVLANCDFPLLNLFVNDWLYRMDPREAGAARPDPEQHPFSVKSLRWRIYEVLRHGAPDVDFTPLERYVAAGDKRDPRKCFKLAGRLAKLLDEYQTYRPEMMAAWAAKGNAPSDETTAWEPALWRNLVQGREDQTCLAAFRNMKAQLRSCGIANAYRRVFVFAPAMLPPAHLEFFRLLGEFMDVDFYLFNPSREDWFDRDTLTKRLTGAGLQERPGDTGDWLAVLHPLLGAYGRGARDLVAGALDLTGGQIADTFVRPADDSLLHALQRSLVECDGTMDRKPLAADGSIQLHLCHGKMREVEILRDQLLKCWDDFPDLQPRHVQVQVADLDAYAPYIEAVFSAAHPNAPDAIPFAIADRVAAGESRAAQAFRQLLELADSRFTAPQLLELLHCDDVARRFGFEPDKVVAAARWLGPAGVRWGRDRQHRADVSGADFTEETSWRHGLDRLLLGYAMGREPAPAQPAGVVPCDRVEGDAAVLLGRLARFYDMLVDFVKYAGTLHAPADWAKRLETLVDDFFVSDNDTYRDLGILKSAIRLLRDSADTAGFNQSVPLAVVRDFLTGHLGETAGGTDLDRNAVVFSSLRPGSSAPRRVQCLLGMGDGLFPRAENRPAYDLLRGARKMGDRSPAIEDRLAFLEVLLNARARLLIFYPAFSEEDNSPACESVAVRELAEYLDRRFDLSRSFAGPPFRVVHRLQAWHPAYFGWERDVHPGLFSYSQSDGATAQALCAGPAETPAAPAGPPPPAAISLEIGELVRFFENHARHYFRRVLGAEPEPNPEDLPADTETFEPGSLEKWEIRNRLLESLAKGEAPAARERLLREFMANGTAPLGQWGMKWWADLERDAQALLARELPRLDTLGAALRARAAAPPREWSVNLAVDGIPVALRGAAPWPGENLLFDFHCSDFKARRLLAAWLLHLLANAAGDQPESLHVQGGKKPQLFKFRPLAAGAAKDLLADYLRVYLFQSAPPPPYTPETAWAYVKELAGNDANGLAALAKARATWIPDPWSRKDGLDSYFVAVFGAHGPFADEAAFATLAGRIMGPAWRNWREGGGP